jgi:tetratricopeptide (TPR) repeat protein
LPLFVLGWLGARAGALPVAYAAESEKTVARGHYETATRAYDLREYAKALEEYKAAYMAKPDPAFLFNIGQCYRKLGNSASAIEFYQQYLKKTGPDDPNRSQAEARIRDVQNGRFSDDGPFVKDEQKAPPVPTEPAGSAVPPTAAAVPAPAAPSAQAAWITPPAPTEPVPPTAHSRWWLWTGIGVAVVGGVVAAVWLSRGGSETNTAGASLGTQGAFQ